MAVKPSRTVLGVPYLLSVSDLEHFNCIITQTAFGEIGYIRP
jgi:hypothetical protein